MGLMLTTDRHMQYLENEVESYRIGLESMSKAHNRVLQQYRELRDSKDEEIAKLHGEIEALKMQLYEKDKETKRLRDAVAWYEENKKCL